MKKVLFVCIHNSARSQMAEALLNKYGHGEFEAFSGGLEPGVLNPLVVEVLKEDEGIDISGKKTKSAFEFVKEGKLFSYVVTVCDEGASQRCPIFPGVRERIMMSFEDPSEFTGDDEEKIEKIRAVKNEIKNEVFKFIKLVKEHKLKEELPKNWKLG